MRFPELSLALAQAGAEILTYPSAFGSVTGPAHWEVRGHLFKTRLLSTCLPSALPVERLSPPSQLVGKFIFQVVASHMFKNS